MSATVAGAALTTCDSFDAEVTAVDRSWSSVMSETFFSFSAAGFFGCSSSAARTPKAIRRESRSADHRRVRIDYLAFLCAFGNAYNLPPGVRFTQMRLDDFIPIYEFNEVHTRHVDASPERVFDACRNVTADEIRFFRAFTFIRRFGRKGQE